MGIPGYHMSTLPEFIDKELGVSGWIAINQETINQFAECTGDRQWIHVDEERAKNEGMFGGTIAHGYLTLSLLAAASLEIGTKPDDVDQAFNYGLDKVRFIAPVKPGDRLRNRAVLTSVEKKDKGTLLTIQNTLEIENQDRPALIADTLVLLA